MSHRFNVAVCLLIKDENDYINEWLGWHIGIGIEHFFIYDNGSTVPIKESVAPEFLDICTFVDFPDPHGNTQYECYADCLKKFGHLTEWLAFIDTDEFIRVVDGTPLPKFLEEFRGHDGLYIKWTVYNADGQQTKDNRPVRERFQNVVEYQPGIPNGKSIIRPARVRAMGPHFPFGRFGEYDMVTEKHRYIKWAYAPWFSCDRITIDHYYTRSLEEWENKMKRGSCDPNCIRKYEEFFQYNPDLRPTE